MLITVPKWGEVPGTPVKNDLNPAIRCARWGKGRSRWRWPAQTTLTCGQRIGGDGEPPLRFGSLLE